MRITIMALCLLVSSSGVFADLVFYPACNSDAPSVSVTMHKYTIAEYQESACIQKKQPLKINEIKDVTVRAIRDSQDDEILAALQRKFENFEVQSSNSKSIITIEVPIDEAKRLDVWTRQNVKSQIVLTLNGEAISVAYLMSAVTDGRFVITTESSEEAANALVGQIRNTFERASN